MWSNPPPLTYEFRSVLTCRMWMKIHTSQGWLNVKMLDERLGKNMSFLRVELEYVNDLGKLQNKICSVDMKDSSLTAFGADSEAVVCSRALALPRRGFSAFQGRLFLFVRQIAHTRNTQRYVRHSSEIFKDSSKRLTCWSHTYQAWV